MESGRVQNTGEKNVDVMWDGQRHYFQPGEIKTFSIGVAREIANLNGNLNLVSGTAPAETAPTEQDDDIDSDGETAEVPIARPESRGGRR